MESSLLQLFPADRRPFWEKVVLGREKELQEIRIRAERPVLILLDGREFFLGVSGELLRGAGENQRIAESAYCVGRAELERFLNHICRYSLYAYEDEFRQGFLTAAGGHRVGIAGQVVREGSGEIRTIKNISCINIRIAHEIRGAADRVLPFLYESGGFKNVLIISPPGCGKTTLLRDLIRQVSDGNIFGAGKTVSVVDERSELAGSWQGLPQNDVGMRTDVLDACPKTQGMMLLLRAMSPQVIAIDELGGAEELAALRMASYCGVGLLATIHGESLRDVMGRFSGENRIFDLFLLLGRENGKPMVREIVRREEAYA